MPFFGYLKTFMQAGNFLKAILHSKMAQYNVKWLMS